LGIDFASWLRTALLARMLSISTVMQFLNRHILAIGRLFLALFFVANSGFTIVQRYCTMAHENHGEACTDDNDGCSAATCNDEGVPPPATAPAITENMSCHVVSIGGGLPSDTTNVEKESSARHISAPLLLAPIPDLGVIIHVDRSLHHLSPAFANVPLHSVETYVLNSTFLI
jgi:hypothetical protein